MKELGPKTYACLKQSDFGDDCSASDGPTEIDPEEEDEVGDEVPDPALPYDDGKEDEVETPDYGSLQDDDEELEDGAMAGVTEYLRMFRTANLGFLDEVDEENLPGVKDLLPLVYAGECGPESVQAEMQWDEARKKY